MSDLNFKDIEVGLSKAINPIIKQQFERDQKIYDSWAGRFSSPHPWLEPDGL